MRLPRSRFWFPYCSITLEIQLFCSSRPRRRPPHLVLLFFDFFFDRVAPGFLYAFDFPWVFSSCYLGRAAPISHSGSPRGPLQAVPRRSLVFVQTTLSILPPFLGPTPRSSSRVISALVFIFLTAKAFRPSFSLFFLWASPHSLPPSHGIPPEPWHRLSTSPLRW